MTVATVEQVQGVARTIEVEVVSAPRITPVRSRTPTVAVASGAVERRPEAITGSGQENRAAIRAGHPVAVVAALTRPCPRTLVY